MNPAEEFNLEAKRREEAEFLNQLEDAKTDDGELAQIIAEYDFDASLVARYDRITTNFQNLKQQFLALNYGTQVRLNSNG